MSATGEADHEWEMEDLSPRQAAVVSCRGAAFEAARSRRGWMVVGPALFRRSPQLTRARCPRSTRLSVSESAGEVG